MEALVPALLLVGAVLAAQGFGILALLYSLRSELRSLHTGLEPVSLWEAWKAWYDGPTDLKRGRNKL